MREVVFVPFVGTAWQIRTRVLGRPGPLQEGQAPLVCLLLRARTSSGVVLEPSFALSAP